MEASGQLIADTAITMVVKPEYMGRFHCFFTEGVTLPVKTGYTLKETICDQLGVAEEYFEDRIQTIFLNFKAVDAPEKALVKDGAMIALSAAMPGLVGATMRKGGAFSMFRSSISFSEDVEDIEQHRGLITLRLLNMIARELGPPMLANGVYVTGEQMTAFFKTRATEFNSERCEVILNGKAVSWEQLIGMELSGKKVYLKVSV